MKTIEEKIAVMQAFKDGKEIEYYHITKKSWIETRDPVWQWISTDYRIKPATEYVPFSFEDAEQLIGKIVKNKETNLIQMITWCDDYEAASITYGALLSNYTFIDGSPCGKLKQ